MSHASKKLLQKDINVRKRAEKEIEINECEKSLITNLQTAKIPFKHIEHMFGGNEIVMQANKNKIRIKFDQHGRVEKVLLNNMEVHEADKDTY